jgi:hypothetical protein
MRWLVVIVVATIVASMPTRPFSSHDLTVGIPFTWHTRREIITLGEQPHNFNFWLLLLDVVIVLAVLVLLLIAVNKLNRVNAIHYPPLAERSHALALFWSIGQGFLVLAFFSVTAGLVGLIIPRIDPDVLRERAISALEASLACGVLFLVISVVLKRYAMKKGGISVSRRP